MKTDAKKLLQRHDKLIHSEMMKVTSHVQRKDGEWIINTVMVEGYEVPFKFKRQKAYKNLKGARVNLTYYPAIEVIAGFNIEIMKVIRIKVA